MNLSRSGKLLPGLQIMMRFGLIVGIDKLRNMKYILILAAIGLTSCATIRKNVNSNYNAKIEMQKNKALK